MNIKTQPELNVVENQNGTTTKTNDVRKFMRRSRGKNGPSVISEFVFFIRLSRSIVFRTEAFHVHIYCAMGTFEYHVPHKISRQLSWWTNGERSM